MKANRRERSQGENGRKSRQVEEKERKGEPSKVAHSYTTLHTCSPPAVSSPAHTLRCSLLTQLIQVEATDTGWPQESNLAKLLPPHSKVRYHQILARFVICIKLINTWDGVVVSSLQDNPAPSGLRRGAWKRSRLWSFCFGQQLFYRHRDYRSDGKGREGRSGGGEEGWKVGRGRGEGEGRGGGEGERRGGRWGGEEGRGGEEEGREEEEGRGRWGEKVGSGEGGEGEGREGQGKEGGKDVRVR